MKSGPGNVKTSCKAVKIIHGNTITVFKRAARKELQGKKNIISSDMTTLSTINDAQLTNLTKNKIMKNEKNTITDSTNQHETNLNDTEMITDDATTANGEDFIFPKKFFRMVVPKRTDSENLVKTQNKFTPLTPHNENDNTTPTPTSNEDKQPPIFFKGVPTRDINRFIETKFKSKVCIKVGSEYNSIKPKTLQDRQALLDELKNSEIEHYTYQLSAQKPRKVVAKYIPTDVTEEDIIEDLARQGIEIIKVARITNRHNEKTSIVQITADKTQLDRLYSITKIYNIFVKIETYRRKSGPTQCFNCQRVGHSSYTCGMQAKCVKCGQEHHTKDCTKTTEQKPKCANCQGEHTANYRGCPTHKDAKKQTSTAQKTKRQEYTPNDREFPRLPGTSDNTNTQQQQRPWGRTQTNDPNTEEGNESLSDIMTLLKGLNLKNVFATIKNTLTKLTKAKSNMDKVMIIAEAVMSFF